MIELKFAVWILLGVLLIGVLVYGWVKAGVRVAESQGHGHDETDGAGDADGPSTWVNGEGTINGEPAIFRADPGLFTLSNSRDYTYELIISVKLQMPDERGFPQEPELDRLYEYEDGVVPAVEEDGWGHLAVVLTTGGFRDFIFYVKDHESVLTRLRPLEADFKDLQVDVQGKEDPAWTQLKRFTGQ